MAKEEMTAIEVPAPTAWPLVLAMGAMFMFAGLLTNISVTVLGVVLSLAGCIGWFREVIPADHEEAVPVVAEDREFATERRVVERLAIAPEQVRAWLPIHTYPVSAGLRGGWAGGIVMAVLACGFGLLKVGSIWYPINLLAAVVYAQAVKLGPAQLNAFHLDSFAIAVGVHLAGSTLVGLLYGAMLPMFPRRPIVLGGLIVPVLWSGMLYSTINLLNPLLGSHIDWFWFIASQVAFGVTAGAVVIRYLPKRTLENISFAVRAGIEAPGTMLVLLAAVLLSGCGVPPGQPRADSIELAPNQVVDFDALYTGNCAGCHGANGGGGAAIALANRVYLAVVDLDSMRASIATGVRGTSMPAFAQRSGGMLTEKQIDALVDGISRWSRPGTLGGVNPPSYAAASAGDVRRGEAAYQTFCQSCHGADGRGGPKGSAITDDSFLALASDQGLRTVVIAGRPELGAPDWRGNVAGRPMTDQEITDVVSWLASHRVATPGQPYVTQQSSIRSVTCRTKLC
jgi:mono/diheme cytochrome c family protein